MSFAIYGESLTYVHLVSADDQSTAIHMFIDDVKQCNIELKDVYNIYAVEGKDECRELEIAVKSAIKRAGKK